MFSQNACAHELIIPMSNWVDFTLLDALWQTPFRFAHKKCHPNEWSKAKLPIFSQPLNKIYYNLRHMTAFFGLLLMTLKWNEMRWNYSTGECNRGLLKGVECTYYLGCLL